MSKSDLIRDTLARLPDFHWSLERYHAAIDAGILDENDKIELLFGKLVPKNTPDDEDATTTDGISQLFAQRLDQREFIIETRAPIVLVDESATTPDVHVARVSTEHHDHHPYIDDLLLVIEVASTSVHRDRGVKRYAYAVSGIVEYWIVNLKEMQLERYTDPDAAGGTYATREVFKTGDTVASLHLGAFAVEELLIE